MHLLLGTRNKGKFLEISEALRDLPISLFSPEEKQILGDPEEEGATYEANAELKARFYAEQSGLPAIADDSGLVVEALAGELGVHTRRWGAGKDATDQEWIDHFLKRMKQEENRNAHFVSTIAFMDHENNIHLFQGICKGTISHELEGDYLPGLPLLSCFKPNGFDRTFALLKREEKNSVNHRHHAVMKFKTHLQDILKNHVARERRG